MCYSDCGVKELTIKDSNTTSELLYQVMLNFVCIHTRVAVRVDYKKVTCFLEVPKHLAAFAHYFFIFFFINAKCSYTCFSYSL